jgi:hypothetical protein
VINKSRPKSFLKGQKNEAIRETAGRETELLAYVVVNSKRLWQTLAKGCPCTVSYSYVTTNDYVVCTPTHSYVPRI